MKLTEVKLWRDGESEQNNELGNESVAEGLLLKQNKMKQPKDLITSLPTSTKPNQKPKQTKQKN